MDKFTVAQIEEDSKITRRTHKGRRGKSHANTYSVEQIRAYCDRVDFLCRTIARLKRK